MGTLFVVATPIGNMEDITVRAGRVLFTVDLVVCEDTRQTGMLLDLIAKRYPYLVPPNTTRPPLLRCDNEKERVLVPEILEKLSNGANIALVSDAGTPLVSDPGFILVSEAHKRNIPVVSVPGASAAITALTSSGLPTDKFMFLGYPPEKEGHRQKLFQSLKAVSSLIPVTYIMYCAPHKFTVMIDEMKTELGDIEITVSRELTKLHEEVWRGSISQSLVHFAPMKGELVILFRI